MTASPAVSFAEAVRRLLWAAVVGEVTRPEYRARLEQLDRLYRGVPR
jgi:hypothetical protein